MKSKKYINKIQPQLEAAFKSQDPDLFDIVFDIKGKKLYADKLILSINSSTFKTMLSDRWISKNNSIKIDAFKFDDFKELLTFIYSGECNITNENILTILDMAEFYQIEDLKELCDEYLSTIELNLSNIYKWSENQAIKKQQLSNDETFDIKDAIKTEMHELLPYLQFKKMKLKFLNEFVVQRGFLFAFDGFANIMKNPNPDARESDNKHPVFIYWYTNCVKPSTPSPLKKRDDVQWYLIYFIYGSIDVRRSSELNDSYFLIAEMFAEKDFDVTQNCKIKIE
uniref:BTB domain-containing protein n=1 Tax=Panagrolaimus davidi TaxID=227884 RepID=A0A914PQ78_9BILA